ncbi:MAG: hypothetical protein MJZ17_02035 [Bacteroidales bacterium]|nr:hypothetical protein [Bacteroidales bacterium]
MSKVLEYPLTLPRVARAPEETAARISGRDEGVSDANDGSRRRNVSGAAFSLTGRCRASDRGLRSSAAEGSGY